MAKHKELTKVNCRFCVRVDPVDVEQAGIEGGITEERQKATAAAWQKSSVLALKKVFDANAIPMKLLRVNPDGSGHWMAIFLVGRGEENAASRA